MTRIHRFFTRILPRFYLAHLFNSLLPTKQKRHFVITGLKISFTGPSDKVSDDFEFESDICMMMSDDLQFSLARK